MDFDLSIYTRKYYEKQIKEKVRNDYCLLLCKDIITKIDDIIKSAKKLICYERFIIICHDSTKINFEYKYDLFKIVFTQLTNTYELIKIINYISVHPLIKDNNISIKLVKSYNYEIHNYHMTITSDIFKNLLISIDKKPEIRIDLCVSFIEKLVELVNTVLQDLLAKNLKDEYLFSYGYSIDVMYTLLCNQNYILLQGDRMDCINYILNNDEIKYIETNISDHSKLVDFKLKIEVNSQLSSIYIKQ